VTEIGYIAVGLTIALMVLKWALFRRGTVEWDRPPRTDGLWERYRVRGYPEPSQIPPLGSEHPSWPNLKMTKWSIAPSTRRGDWDVTLEYIAQNPP
jgi:hypothetical protein